jgi:hypothetical protein
MSDDRPTKSPVEIVGLIAAFVVLGCAKACLQIMSKPSRAVHSVPEDRPCVVATEPPGARVVMKCHDDFTASMNEQMAADWKGPGELPSYAMGDGSYEMEIGTTPISSSRFEWTTKSVVCSGPAIATLAGYEPTRVGCGDTATTMKSNYAERPDN